MLVARDGGACSRGRRELLVSARESQQWRVPANTYVVQVLVMASVFSIAIGEQAYRVMARIWGSVKHR